MAYNNYGPPPGAFGGPQAFGALGGPPPTYGAAPGMDAPPGMAAHSPAGMPAQFPPSAQLGNINFNAPVIRLGVDGQRQGSGQSDRERGGRDGRGSNAEPLGNRNRMGLGADSGHRRDLDRERQQVRENMLALQPPTREEVARTIFVGGLNKHVPDDRALEDILRCAGKLRRWTRARDADDRKCKFGFAEYEDVESLEAAAEIFPGIVVPLFNPDGSLQREEGDEDDGEGSEKPVKRGPLLVVVDEQSKEYIDQWKGRKREDESARQFRIDSCKEELGQVIAGIINHAAHTTNGINGQQLGDRDGDQIMGEANGERIDGAEVITIPLSLEDELADIPADMRATVAEEIKAFRDRSNRRDIERLRREEELEQEERRRTGGARANRLATPPPGGANGPNGIPVGPRGQQGVQGAPSGPKGFRGAQLPSDYANGVTFVQGAGPNGVTMLNPEEEDAEESDEELERRRKEKKDAELDKQYQDAVRRWQNRERQRGAAQERERKREEDEQRQIEKARADMMHRLANWNDDEEAEKGRHFYYKDRTAWVRQREYEREQERRDDDIDRKAEEREKADERRRENEARGMADDFLGSMTMDSEPKPAEQPAGFGGFKISLGSAAAKSKQAQAAPAPKRAMADVEGLLEDEEDAVAAGLKRPELKPLQDTSTVPNSGLGLTDEEKAAARQALASEIPTDTAALFEHPIKWDSISTSLLDSQIRPFVERKVVEYLGVQEDLIVDTVLDGTRNRIKARDLIEELLGPLEDEAEVLVKKVWRLLVFWGECESRGLSA